MYYPYHYWGMHVIWWIIWFILLLWIFVIPYDIPGQKNKKDSPLDILKKRYVTGQISNKEFLEKKKMIEE